MPRLPKKLDEDLEFLEDFNYDYGFVLTMIESAHYGHAEDALVEMAAIVRDRIDVVLDRDGDAWAFGEVAAALVLVERMLSVWRHTFQRVDASLDDALHFATATIDRFDSAFASTSARSGRRVLEPLRDLVNIDRRCSPGGVLAAVTRLPFCGINRAV